MILNKRTKPRRQRPDLFFRGVEPESWEAISLRVRTKWWTERTGHLKCGICGKPIANFSDLVADHREPGKMGGCKDHSEENLQPAHSWCNLEKGSKRNFTLIKSNPVPEGEK